MANEFNPDLFKDKGLAKLHLENANAIGRIRAEKGWLGHFWGSSSSIPNNIAALTILLLLISGLIYTFCVMNTPADKATLSIKDFWSIISPLITLAIGYLFGDKKGKPEGESN